MDLIIEENTLKHISEGIEYYLYTFLKLTTLLSLNLGEGKLQIWDFSVLIFNFCTQITEK